MGTGVFGGMLLATFVATIFVPLFFVMVARRGRNPGATHEDYGSQALVGTSGVSTAVDDK
jgi:hypothetical protein